MEIVISMNALYEETTEYMHRFVMPKTFAGVASAVRETIEYHVKSVWLNETGQDEVVYTDASKIQQYVSDHINSSIGLNWVRKNPNADICGVLYTLGTTLKLQVVKKEYRPRYLAIADWVFTNEE